jgi:2-polyprenyl-3-methyl-5-hydroxy-6-metoxy-1,4-benzoquinol methylase
MSSTSGEGPHSWDHSSHEQFFDHYASRTEDPAEVKRCCNIRDTILRFFRPPNSSGDDAHVLDVGCAGGALCMVWAELGFKVHGLDVNQPLLEFARERASTREFQIDYQLGSAIALPWPDASMDICIALELLEHVPEWETCLAELTRVVRPGGILFMSTSNKLCPIQSEFNLPGFSWYPASWKRYFARLASTTRPDLANYAKYPAVNWFTPYGLGRTLRKMGFRTLDRFDLVDSSKLGATGTVLLTAIRTLPLLRFLAHVCTTGAVLLSVREAEAQATQLPGVPT